MFEHHQSSFGQFQKHTFINTSTQTGFSLVPAFGACLLDISFQGQSILDGYATPTQMLTNAWYKNVLLLPFPNRLNNGTYQWQGQTYRFPINDTHTENALHGFSPDYTPMIFKATELKKASASIELQFFYDGSHPAYPFPFTFNVTYAITAQRFEITLQVKNEGKNPMPFGMGWHPYFKIGDHINNLKLKVPSCEWIGVNQKMIPTGKRYDYEEFVVAKKIGTTVLDNCFAIKNMASEGRFEVQLQSEKEQLTYWQETGPRKFNFIQLFTPPHRASMAIEPMTCNVDGFNNEEGLIVLKEGEEVKGKFGMTYEFIR